MRSIICIAGFAALLFQAIQHGSAHGKEEHFVPSLKLKPSTTTAAPQMISKEVATCYEGYTLMSDGTCVKEIVEEPISSEGIITVPPLTICDEGFLLSGNGKCVKTTESELSYFCPKDYEDAGSSCVQSLPGETVTTCESGELVQNVCILKEKKPHLVEAKCPEGSAAESDGNCWKVVSTFDCTPKDGKEERGGRIIVPQASHLKKGTIVTKGKEHGRQRSLFPQKQETREATLPYVPPSKHSVPGRLVDGKEKTTTTTTRPVTRPTPCPSKEFVSVSPPQATKVSPVSQTCARKTMVDAMAVVSCPDGYEDFEDACVKETRSAPSNLCLTNGSTKGACPPTIKRVAKKIGCADGKRPVGKKCLDIETRDTTNVCAEGFKDNGHQGCTGRVKSGELECRPGLRLVDDKCIGKSVRPSVSVTLKPKPGCEKKY